MAFNRIVPVVRYNELPAPVGQVAPVPSALSDLLYDLEETCDGAPAVRCRSDNYLLLHQKDLENRIGFDNVRKWMQSLNASATSSSEVQQMLDKMSDRELFSVLRSRHIQQPSEIKMYEEQILSDVSKLYARRDALVAEARAAAAAGASDSGDSGESDV